MQSHPDIRALHAAFDAAERDARALVAGLGEPLGTWRPDEGSWSVADCLEHLAISNRVYLHVMEPAGARALAAGRKRRGAAKPGLFGRAFVWTFEPPVRSFTRLRSPRKIRPSLATSLANAVAQLLASNDEVRAFLSRYQDIDLAGVLFPNPFVRGLRLSLATGLHVLAAHERRHLWQAWRVRNAAERALGPASH